jgi:hypothetical protein
MAILDGSKYPTIRSGLSGFVFSFSPLGSVGSAPPSNPTLLGLVFWAFFWIQRLAPFSFLERPKYFFRPPKSAQFTCGIYSHVLALAIEFLKMPQGPGASGANPFFSVRVSWIEFSYSETAKNCHCPCFEQMQAWKSVSWRSIRFSLSVLVCEV